MVIVGCKKLANAWHCFFEKSHDKATNIAFDTSIARHAIQFLAAPTWLYQLDQGDYTPGAKFARCGTVGMSHN